MKERPIIFSAPMVRAILAGTKTQTRRVVVPGVQVHGRGAGAHPLGDQQWAMQPASRGSCAGCGSVVNSRHRVGGDRLYVRETWAAPHAYDHLPPRLIPQDARIHYAATEDHGGLMWRSPIFMPRWASRITLEITGVRVERLQDISEADARCEGVGKEQCPDWHAVADYRALWEQINGPGSWDANPWVWVISFERVEAGHA